MTVFYLTKRNMLKFLRDRGAVFFSLLSMVIVLMLMAVFLGDMNVEEALELLRDLGGQTGELQREQAGHLIQMWTIAGILVVNSVTVSAVILGNLVTDAAEGRLAGFYIAPVKRIEIALGYILASVFTGMLFCLVTLAASCCYVALTGGPMLSVEALGKITGLIFLNCCVFSAMMYLVALFVKSSGAWSGLVTVIGTLVGFVGAIYLPMGMLPEPVGRVLKCLPVLHGTSLMRNVFTRQAVDTLFDGMDERVAAGYREAMGITISMKDKLVPEVWSVVFLVICGAAALLAAALWMRFHRQSDR